MGMHEEIDAALQAHAAWRKRFKDYLSGRASLDVTSAGTTDHCHFGQWLDKEGYRLMPTELHDQIREAHAEFHRVAAEIIHHIKEKRFAEAREAMRGDGAFDRASVTLSDLMRRATLRERRTEPAGAASAPAPATLAEAGENKPASPSA